MSALVSLILWVSKWTCCLIGGFGCLAMGAVAALVLLGNGVRTLGERRAR